MTEAKVMDIISRWPGCDGQAADAVSAYTQEKEDAAKLLKIPWSECPDIWIRLPRHKWPKSWSSNEDPVVHLERNLYGHPLAGLFWERQFEKILLIHGWEKIPNWECLFVHPEKGLFLSVYVDDIKLVGKKQNIDPMWKVLGKEVDSGEPTSFFGHVYLGCTQRQCEIRKDIVDNYRAMFESRIFRRSNWKIPCSENLCISSWPRHAKKCVERYCELANRTTQQLYKVSTPCIDDHHFKEELKSVGELSKVCSQMVLKCTFIMYAITNNIVMWEKLQNNADWDCFKTPILREIFEDSESTSAGTLCVFGGHTFVPVSWMCKKQTSVSHSSTGSEIISLDAGLRMDGIPALDFWDLIVTVLRGNTSEWSSTERPVWISNAEEISWKDWWSRQRWLLFRQTSILLVRKLCCTFLKTPKQWSRWSWREEARQWDMFPEPTEMLLIGYSIESIWTTKSKSNTLTPKTNLQTC